MNHRWNPEARNGKLDLVIHFHTIRFTQLRCYSISSNKSRGQWTGQIKIQDKTKKQARKECCQK